MLDQNTDRMWYVIGAVIVGAAIIFLANGTLPSLFASVGDSFDVTSANALSDVDTFRPNTGFMNDGRKDYERLKPAGFNETNLFNIHTVIYGQHIHNSGERNRNLEWALSEYIPVEGNKSYTFISESPSIHKKILYYDANKDVIIRTSSETTSGSQSAHAKSHTAVAPAHATYAVIASVYNDFRVPVGYSPVYEWWFGETAATPDV